MTEPAAPTMVFTQDELQTIRLVLDEWGFEDSLRADADKVSALLNKLGRPVDKYVVAK